MFAVFFVLKLMEENLFGIWINGECIELILKNEDNDKVKMINLDNIWDLIDRQSPNSPNFRKIFNICGSAS